LKICEVLCSFVEDEENIKTDGQEQNDGEAVISTVERIGGQQDDMLDGEKDDETNNTSEQRRDEPADNDVPELGPVDGIKSFGSSRKANDGTDNLMKYITTI
jgi:hypothetical protein